MGENLTFFEQAFMQWYFINRPEFLIEGTYKGHDIEAFAQIRTLAKQGFLYHAHEARNNPNIIVSRDA
jgi:hypothetical protein